MTAAFPDVLPDSRRPRATDVPSLRWGVLGTGWVAERFVASLTTRTTQRVIAVGSRTQDSADRFAKGAGIERAYGTQHQLVADPDVDVVYVATPHHIHRDNALLAIGAGKHVLVEKPLGLDADQAGEIFAAAANAGVFCMEGMWTLLLPRYDVVRRILDAGLLGDVRTVLADHGERFDPPHRILDPALAGGSLLDLGTYLTTLATWVLGPAVHVHASGETTPSGVNGQAAMVLTHARAATSVLHCSIVGRTPMSASISGTAATITIPAPFYGPGDIHLTSADGSRTVIWTDPEPIGHQALYYSAIETARCIDAGLTHSPLLPPEAVVTGLRALDAVAEQVGETYAAVR